MWSPITASLCLIFSTFAAAEVCDTGAPENAQMLLQAHRAVNRHGPEGANASSITELTDISKGRKQYPKPDQYRNFMVSEIARSSPALNVTSRVGPAMNGSTRTAPSMNFSYSTNPSGAAAPLDEVGYSAVADRCCQAEMVAFIERQVVNLGYEVCEESGLFGLVVFHSCSDRQDFDKLSADILSDSENQCTWVAKTGQCAPMPDECPQFPDVPPAADCGCTKSNAATVDLAASTITANNLGGEGPNSGEATEEIRYSGTNGCGVTASGEPFDVVITALNTYSGPQSNLNGKSGSFGRINLNRDSETNFQVSFMQPRTNVPVTVSEIHMALFDLDGTETNGKEYASSSGYKGYVTDATPSILASRGRDGSTQFDCSGLVDDIPNPTSPATLTQEQRQNSVMFFYTDVSSFQLTFGIDGPDHPYSRNLFFAFESELADRCAA